MSQPTLSVVLPVFNSARTLREAIASIQWQTFCDWELLLIDDGSQDESLKIAADFKDARIHIVSEGVHRGLPAQLNRAIKMARGKFIARMDSDDVAYPQRFERQIRYLQAHAEVDLVAAWMIVFRSDGTLLGARRSPVTHELICARPWSTIPMAHPTWVGRKEWFERNGYREDALRMEDRELLYRTHSQSRFACIPEVLLGYREDSISLPKILMARRHACRIMAEAVFREQSLRAVAGIFGQLCRAGLDTVAIGSGMGYRILRHRATPLTNEEASEWNTVWANLARPVFT